MLKFLQVNTGGLNMADIIIYGGGFAAVAAAAKAANNSPNKSVLVVAPYPTAKLGGIATIGGQNYWDTRQWNGKYVQKGTFSYWYNTLGSHYNTDEMAQLLLNSISKYSNVTIKFQYDVVSFERVTNPYRISSLTFKNIYRDTDGNIKWGNNSFTETGSMFIDASEEGRLARLVNSAVTTGRYDWPENYIDETEKNNQRVGRQQAVTLMFKMTGITPGTYSDMSFYKNPSTNVYACWGGRNACKNNATILNFNNTYGSQGYILKPVNAAQNGPNTSEWWINAFLIFNVDGRANYRDKGTSLYPTYMLPGYKNTDEAWISAREFLKNTPEFLNAIRQFDGFSNAEFVTKNGYPVVGDILYIRETVHMAKEVSNIANNSENNYALTTKHGNNAGASATNGSDSVNYNTRIGLNYYNADVHPYTVDDLKDSDGNYLWAEESWAYMRPDLNITANSPANPVYVPYSVLTTNYVSNLLLPGYAAGVSSFSWGEVRVFPNLCVLGDAAGITAAYCINNNKQPLYLEETDIKAIQNLLLSAAEAELEK